MKQFLHVVFFIVFVSTHVFAQNIPSVKIKDEKDLKLTDVKVTVDIVGNLAITSYDMKFYNGLSRTLEGELVFPLGEGQTVSGFAMDVNGKMRDAVIVEKELGRVAYETTIRRRIDPGLLEKTEGNNYKARVYPIFPRKEKHIIITFEQELSTLDGKQTYELPLGITRNLDTFSVTLNIFNNQQPVISKTVYKNFFFKKEGEAYTASISKNNHAPKAPIVIQIPNKTNQESLHTYNGYFHYYKALQPKTRLKEKPRKVAILWDASYSMRYRDVEKELKVLQSYLEYLRNVKVNFIAFNNNILTNKDFKIKDGNANALLEEIKNLNYDGGTKLNLFQDTKIKADEVLLFSDGLANLGDFGIKRKMPVYTINSLVSANHQSLNDIATQSGGSYLNLLRLEYTKAAQLLKKETYQFLGFSTNKKIREVYPQQRTNVYQDFSVSGQFTDNTTMELLFGYGGKVTEKIPVEIKTANGSKEVKRLWAKQKLKNLYRSKEKNKGAIISLAKQYSLITDYTSLIVLDRIQDYVRYKIEPPKELMEQYKALLETAKRAEKRRAEQLQNRIGNLQNSYREIDKWHASDFKFEPEANKGLDDLITLKGTVIDNEEYPLIGATILVKGTSKGTIADFDGNYTLQVRKGQKLVISYVGFEPKEVMVRSGYITTELSSDIELEEVIITAQGNRRRADQSAIKMSRSDIAQVLQGSAGGLYIEQNNSVILGSEGSGIPVEMGSGAPGQTGNVVIRGNNSLNNSGTPIIIIDGIFSDQQALNRIQPKDIHEAIVLKNKEAAAICGFNAPDGLMVVTTKKAFAENKASIKAFNKKVKEKISLKPWNTNMSYIKKLQKETTIAAAYKKYLEIREAYTNTPTFYLDVADFFHSREATDVAITIITNLVEIELHNYELLRAAAYKLEYFKRYETAVLVYEKVLEIRPEEPQSYRDLALAYEEVGEIQKSYDLLYALYKGQLLKKDESRRFTGVEQIAYVELARLVNKYAKELKLTKEEQKAFTAMPVDVRIVIDWNHNETDIDLWVFDPKGEKAYYQNPRTEIGGRMSDDLRQGYGPEEYMLRNEMKGVYDIYVNYFTDRVQKISGPTILKITMYTDYGKKNEEKTITVVHLDKNSRTLEVGNLSIK
ncbi:VIT domain-containing protein [Kordia sp.]|uniref:VIT domain-containing protein n=1 Tax=Kordia sp. TaxID=1965332 RepID=UPI003B5CA0AD